jgi:hypothetical protein
MLAMPRVDAVEGYGLRQDTRYFHLGDPGRDRSRQVSLIDEGTIQRHELRFGPIERSLVKAQIILAGDIYLPDLVGSVLSFEEGAELTLSVERKPCFAMDLIAPGLREAMEPRQQGVLAQVTRGGVIVVGQRVLVRVSSDQAVQEDATDVILSAGS